MSNFRLGSYLGIENLVWAKNIYIWIFTALTLIPLHVNSGELYWPLDCTPGDARCSSYIGYPDIDNDGIAFNCDSPGYTGHEGTDISVYRSAMVEGLDVKAAADGEVLWVFDGKYDDCPSNHPDCQAPVAGQSDGYQVCSDTGWCFYGGNVVIIRHPDSGTIHGTRYDHLKKNSIVVQPGQLIKAGEKIAQAASAGASTGPHLHFEVWANDIYDLVDPWSGSCGTNTGSSLWKYDIPWVAQPLTLPADQWALISIPGELPESENTVAAVFGDDIDGIYGTDWVVFSFNSATQKYGDPGINGELYPGIGYWITHAFDQPLEIDIPTTSNVTATDWVNGCSTSTCVEIAPVTNGADQWHLVGNPFSGSVSGNNIIIKSNNGGVCSNGCGIAEATSADLIHDVFYRFAGSAYEPVTDQGIVEGWSGFWIATKGPAQSAGLSVLFSADGT